MPDVFLIEGSSSGISITGQKEYNIRIISLKNNIELTGTICYIENCYIVNCWVSMKSEKP